MPEWILTYFMWLIIVIVHLVLIGTIWMIVVLIRDG